MYPSHLVIACKEPPSPHADLVLRTTSSLPRHSSSSPALVSTDFGAGGHWCHTASLVLMVSIDVVFVGFSRQICINWRLPPSAIPRSSEAFHYIDSILVGMPLVVLICCLFLV